MSHWSCSGKTLGMMITVVNNIKSNKFSSAGNAENKIKKYWALETKRPLASSLLCPKEKKYPELIRF